MRLFINAALSFVAVAVVSSAAVAQDRRINSSTVPVERACAPGTTPVDAMQFQLDRMRDQSLKREVAGSKGAADESRDRRKAALDNIQKFLDIVRSMEPQI